MNEAKIAREIIVFLSKQHDYSALRSKLLKTISPTMFSTNTRKDTYETINRLEEAGCLTFHRDSENRIYYRLEEPAFKLFSRAKD